MSARQAAPPSGLRIAINTTSTIAGGAITHLLHLLPALSEEISDEQVAILGDAPTLDRLKVPSAFERLEFRPAPSGLASRLRRENSVVPGILRDWGADVLFHPGNFAVFRSPVTQVILIHNLAPFLDEVVRSESLRQRVRLRLLRQLTTASLNRVARVVFISDFGRRLVVGEDRQNDERFPVVPFGAEHLVSKPSREPLARWHLEPDAYVLTVSHVYRYKRLEKLIDAYVALGDRVKQWPLVIVGDPFDRDYVARLEARAAESRAPVVFTGALDSDSIGSLMNQARAFVFTSEAENLPITLLEAMAAGSAIVTNRHCSMPEVCADAVAYADPSSGEQYRKQLERILWDDELRATMRDRARGRAASFTWSETARSTLHHLRAAASGAISA